MAANIDRQEQPLLPTSRAGAGRHRHRSSVKGKQKTRRLDDPTRLEICGSFAILVLIILGGVHVYRHYWPRIFGPFDPVEYSVTIAAVSGLDPETNLAKHWLPNPAKDGLVHPAFNLTLRVASPSTARGRECVEAGTSVEVSYLRSRVPLATGPVPAFCVEVGEEREEDSVVAWGHGVRLPSFVFDSLEADMRLGKAEFGVKIIPPLPAYCGGGKSYCSSVVSVISCWSKIGGDRAPCNVSRERASLPVPRPGRDSAYLPHTQ
ncbi:hypothetical protein EJB05_33218, partial [Eragrostis curvula]